MDVLRKPPTVKGPPQLFTGDVWLDLIATPAPPSRLRVGSVHFTPGARTAWHSHALGQTLYVIEGVGYVQSRGGELVVMRPGDVVHTPADEWHWHGATPDHFMTHLAMYELPESGPDAQWGAHVTDAEYGA